jgi:glycosyltransferase involved in cell wall biosynthesis
MSDLAVVILTHNEEQHLARALSSVALISKQVFVIDSYSTDRTVEIAEQHGATVLQNKFINYSKQFQWALDEAPITAAWVMRLDADEIIEADLQDEIQRKIPNLPDDVAGINLKRKHVFLGRWVRHGGRYPLILLRIWRRNQGRIEDRWMDEHMLVWGGRTITFDGGFADHNLKDLTFFTQKHNSYATREAIDVLSRELALLPTDQRLTAGNSSLQASIKRFLKEQVYNRIPFTLSALSYFLYRYVFQLGFLDGRSGLVYHFLQGYWYRFLVGAKVMEYKQAIAHLRDKAEIRAELERLTGFQLQTAFVMSSTVQQSEVRGPVEEYSST